MDSKIYNLPNGFPIHLFRKGVGLQSIGTNRMAWKCDDVLKVIDFLTQNSFGILGGDVLVLVDGELTYTYDNWYLDRYVVKGWEQYVLDSKEKAISYINMYKERNGDDFLYSIVFCARD